MKYAIIGFPVEHSLSPRMHEAGFKAANIGAQYHRIPVKLTELKESIEFLKHKGYAGWNVTYPLKERIISYLDSITSTALSIGAVNTVKVVNGSLMGDNTDGEGFIESLKAKGFDFNDKKIVILGAGGSAKAIAVALAQRNVHISICNRDIDRAKKLVDQISAQTASASWGEFSAGSWLQDVDLLIQTTPVGMKAEEYPFSLKGINPGAWVMDIIYSPSITPFLAEAARYGCHTINGLEMLLHQGALAWRFWFNLEAPIPVMRDVLLNNKS